MIFRDQQPPLEYGPRRRYLACLVCTSPIEGGAEPVCSDACWVAVRKHVAVDALPDGLNRDEQLELLIGAGRRLAWVSAWYGLSPGTVKNIVRGVERPSPRDREAGEGWLDKPAPGRRPKRRVRKAASARKRVQCVVCAEDVDSDGGVTGTVRPVCSDRCAAVLRDRLGIDELPPDATRDEAIVALVAAGRTRRDVAAWFSLSLSRINMLVHADPAARTGARGDTGGAAQSRRRGWLDR
ncbi:hypothetical protein [Zhihengliuella halotolerans]|uniref:Uncharacterized protein n=1 Tax=Zhihengliuella halotolerans TaxID=370736 RepID=A0A4Q8ACC9_9MICC|nr:hypothetical protein [Zhihengliuella halotolerans]RZU61724.1 hypothetical protein EV380_1302 [Zhihengliuella halotolerans]